MERVGNAHDQGPRGGDLSGARGFESMEIVATEPEYAKVKAGNHHSLRNLGDGDMLVLTVHDPPR